MFLSIFTDELGKDITEGLAIIKSWGLEYVDLRCGIFDLPAEDLPPDALPQLRRLLAEHGMKIGCLESSLAKIHLPDAARQQAEAEKLERLIRLADAVGCRLVRSFHYWQPPPELSGTLPQLPGDLERVLEMFAPLAQRAREAGLILAFENCGVKPDEVLAVLDALNTPGWGMAWDVCNTWDCEERRRDEDAYIARMIKRAKLLHVKATGAVAGYGEPIPYQKILQACVNAGLPGPVSVETHNPARDTVGHVEMSKSVVEALQKVWPVYAVKSGNAPAARKISRPWENDPVRFVVAGVGGMGSVRAREIAKTPGVRLAGVCDIVEEHAVRAGGELGVPWATDLKQLLERNDAEVVFVLTATGRHAEVGLQALAAGRHVLVTKPMDASVAACDEMIRLAEKKGLLLGVDFGRRFDADTLALKAAVAASRFGRLLSGNCALKIQRSMDYFHSGGGWRGTWRWDGGGVFSNQSIHHIDELAFAVGVPAKVRCNIWTQNHAIEAEDLGSAVWLYNSGLVITFLATSNYPQDTWYCHLELEGTGGAYCRTEGGPFEKPLSRWFVNGAWTDTPPQAVEPPWLNAMDNFAAAVRTGAALVCTGRDGRKSQAILDAMYRSAREADGGWVEVRPEPVRGKSRPRPGGSKPRARP